MKIFGKIVKDNGVDTGRCGNYTWWCPRCEEGYAALFVATTRTTSEKMDACKMLEAAISVHKCSLRSLLISLPSRILRWFRRIALLLHF